MYRKFGKRAFDLAGAISLIFVFLPLHLIITSLTRLKLGSPVFFFQDRLGEEGYIFRIVKVRSMNEERDKEGNLLSDAKRTTRLGRFLRSSSLDELPGLFNVIRGEMSLIGPRPLLPQYLERYNSEQARRHEVRPGITGWAQVN